MTENRITETGTFGPVFATGVQVDGGPVAVTEGLVEMCLRRHDAFLMVEMTVPAANELADQLLVALDRAIPPTNPQERGT